MLKSIIDRLDFGGTNILCGIGGRLKRIANMSVLLCGITAMTAGRSLIRSTNSSFVMIQEGQKLNVIEYDSCLHMITIASYRSDGSLKRNDLAVIVCSISLLSFTPELSSEYMWHLFVSLKLGYNIQKLIKWHRCVEERLR